MLDAARKSYLVLTFPIHIEKDCCNYFQNNLAIYIKHHQRGTHSAVQSPPPKERKTNLMNVFA
jgi:hypothetical protein